MVQLRVFPLVKDGGIWYQDITGARFARLVVKERVPTPAGYRGCRHWWRCECDCGSTHFVLTNNLLRGHVKSCGCICRQRLAHSRDRNDAIITRRKTTTETANQIADHFGVTKGVVMGILSRAGMCQPRQPSTREAVVFPPASHCVFPLGHPRAADFRFCGDPIREGSSYCETHHSDAYIKGTGVRIKVPA